MATISELIRAYTRQHGLPRCVCGHELNLADPDSRCKECEKEKGKDASYPTTQNNYDGDIKENSLTKKL